jgi:hypothetical protein
VNDVDEQTVVKELIEKGVSSDPTTLLDNFRKRSHSRGFPVFFGSFHLSEMKIALVNDKKDKSSEINEIVLYATTFKAEYCHYDAQDLQNEH